MFRTEIVRTRERFTKLGPDWNILWRDSGSGVFQHHSWIEAWFDSPAGASARPNIGVCWCGDELVAVLPCVISQYNGVRLLEWAAQSFSDYCDGIGDAERMAELLDLIIENGRFDLLRLKHVRRTASVFETLRRRCGDEVRFERCLGVRSQWKDGESWFATLNKKKRNNHRRGLRILAEDGEVSFKVLSGPDGLSERTERLITLKRQWLAANKLKSDLLETDALGPLAGALQKIGRLRVFVLECGSELVAGLVSAAEGERLLAFFAAYNPAFDRTSPGILLMTEATKWAFDHEFKYVDYLRGEEAYKFEFANDETPIAHFTSGRTLIGRSANLAHSLLAARRPVEISVAEVGAAYYTANGTPRRVQ